MTAHLAFSLVTLFPLAVLLLTASISVRDVLEQLDDHRLLLLPAILVLMAQHQLLEAWSFLQTGVSVGLVPSEFIETGANVLSSVAVYYGIYSTSKKQELADTLAESEQRYRALTEQSPLPVFVVQDDEIAFANSAAGRMLAGGDPDLLLDRELTELVHSTADFDPTAMCDGGSQDDSTQATEQLWVDLDGTEHVVLVSATRAQYQGSDSLYLVWQDVTEREEYKKSYQQTKSRLESALRNSNDAILIVDPEERVILDANERAFEMLGYSHDELLGLPPAEIHPHETEQLDLFFERVRAEDELNTDQLSCMRRDGQTIPVDISASTTEYGSRECILAVVRDKTERRTREKQLEVLRRVLRHNLRNDMSVVIGLAEQVQIRGRTEVAEFGSKIKSIANDLLDTSNTVRNIQNVIEREQLEPTRVDLTAVVDDVTSWAQSNYPGAIIRTDVPPNVSVHGTKTFETALRELVENALEHTDSEQPWVKIDIQQNDLRRGNWIDVSVLDNGPGIPDHEKDVIDMNATQTPLSHASGMGLWAANQVVTAFGGDMSIDDHLDGGSVVTMHLRASQTTDPGQTTI